MTISDLSYLTLTISLIKTRTGEMSLNRSMNATNTTLEKVKVFKGSVVRLLENLIITIPN